MKTFFLLFTFFFSLTNYAQKNKQTTPEKEYYFTTFLKQRGGEGQIFHVDANGKKYEYVILGKINDGHKQFLNNKYRIKQSEFKLENLDKEKQKLKLDSVKLVKCSFNSNADYCIQAKISETDVMEDKWIKLEFEEKIKLIRYKVLDIKIKMFDEVKGDYEEIIKGKKGFGDHICKSIVTF